MLPIQIGYALVIVALLYIGGLIIARLCLPTRPPLLSVLLAIPFGMGLWVLLWVPARLSFSQPDFGWADPANRFAAFGFLLFLGLGILTSVIARVWTRQMVAWALISGVCILAYAAFYYLFSGKLVLSGDSHVYINWAYDAFRQMKSGFSLPSLAWTNLSTLMGPDAFLGVLYPLVGLSLALLVYFSIVEMPVDSKLPAQQLVAAAIGFLLVGILVFNEMYFRHMQYINQHSFMTFSLLGCALAVTAPPRISWREIMLIGWLVLLVSTARMEGFLYAAIVVVLCAYGRGNLQETRQILLGAFVISLPLIILLMLLHWDEGRIRGWQYAVMLAAWLGAYAAAHINRLSRFFVEWRLSAWVLGGLVIASALTFVFRPVDMGISFAAMAYNTINPKYWGFATLSGFFLVPMLVWLRWKSRSYWRPTDAFITAALAAIMVSFVIAFFRPPLRIGIDDSANRMLLHVMPLIFVWIGLEAKRLILKLMEGEARG